MANVDPLAGAAPYVAPNEALMVEMTACCAMLTNNNMQTMGVRANPWVAPVPVPIDIARDRAERICAQLFPYFQTKVGKLWCGIVMTPTIACGVVTRVVRFRGSWPGVAKEIVEHWATLAGSNLHEWVSALPGWAGTQDHCLYLVQNVVSAYTGAGAHCQKVKRLRDTREGAFMTEMREVLRTVVAALPPAVVAAVPPPVVAEVPPAVVAAVPPPVVAAPALARGRGGGAFVHARGGGGGK